MSKYKMLYLDADDTLFDFGRAERFAIEKLFTAHDLNFDEEIFHIYTTINKKLWVDIEQQKITQAFLRTERFRLLFSELKLDMDESVAGDEYLNWLAEGSFLLDGAESVCRTLAEHCRLAIITNGISNVQKLRLAKSSIGSTIEHLIISEEARFSKPNRGIFEYAERLTGFNEKSQILMVGDSLVSDIGGGINYGIDTCWFNPKSLKNDKNIVPTFQIEKLSELIEIVLKS